MTTLKVAIVGTGKELQVEAGFRRSIANRRPARLAEKFPL